MNILDLHLAQLSKGQLRKNRESHPPAGLLSADAVYRTGRQVPHGSWRVCTAGARCLGRTLARGDGRASRRREAQVHVPSAATKETSQRTKGEGGVEGRAVCKLFSLGWQKIWRMMECSGCLVCLTYVSLFDFTACEEQRQDR